jgi:hypothetical protein
VTGTWLGALGAAALLASTAAAQGPNDDCFPSRSSNEARTMAKFGVPLAFSAAAAPERRASGGLRVGLELSYVPTIDRETATPTFCRPGKGPENTELLSLVPRPRVSLTLPAGFAAEASWIPPMRIAEVQANLVSAALSYTATVDARSTAVSVRAHGTFGVIKAPITCDDAALADPMSECYQGTRSDDAFHPNVFGIDVAVGWRLGRSLRPYMGAGYSRLAPRFQVNFTNQFGEVDRRKVTVDLNRAVLFAGATWRATGAFELSGEIYSAPADAVTARVAARVLLGKQ